MGLPESLPGGRTSCATVFLRTVKRHHLLVFPEAPLDTG